MARRNLPWLHHVQDHRLLDVRVNTVGGAMFGVECKIVDPETGEDLPTRWTRVLCRGYNIMKGYYKMPEPPPPPSTRTLAPHRRLGPPHPRG